jgi:hypothetical protein
MFFPMLWGETVFRAFRKTGIESDAIKERSQLMIEEIEIGQMYGELAVTEILPAGKILCECSCGREMRTIARELVQGYRKHCKFCDRKSSEGAQPAADLVKWEGLSEKLKARIARAYGEHRRACRDVGMPVAPFEKFLTEFLQDPDSAKDERPMTFEERLSLSNPQRYRVYDRPREMV